MSNVKRSAVVAITGGIACGKSEVGRILGDMGLCVSDADAVAHQLMEQGSPVYQAIVNHFGRRVLEDDGEISRSMLGRIVFNDHEEREALNRLVHPAVREVLDNWIAERRRKGESAAVQIPLLFESGMDTLDWDAIVCVSTSEPLVMERLLTRGMDSREARLRMDAQYPLAEKERRADRVILNMGTIQELKEATYEALKGLLVER